MSLARDAEDPQSLAGFLALIETQGDIVLLSRSLEGIVSLEARVALHAAGVSAGAEAALSWPCDVRGCSREIRSNYSGARKPLVAVCCQVPTVCEPVELGFDEVSQQRISAEALVSAVCGLLRAEIDPPSLAAVSVVHPVGGNRPPILVASSRAPARDVFWAAAPRDMDLAAFCARRERVPRRTLLLVPTQRHVPLEVMARYAAGEKVEVLSLAEALRAEDGVLAFAKGDGPPPPLFSTRPPPGAIGSRTLAAELRITRWEDLRILVVDDRTLRLEAKEERLVRTMTELGFVDRRKTKEGAVPVTAWHVLLLLCHKGFLRPSEYQQFGKQWGAKKGLEDLRVRLRAAFGIDEDPLLSYLTRSGWRPRFRVNPVRV